MSVVNSFLPIARAMANGPKGRARLSYNNLVLRQLFSSLDRSTVDTEQRNNKANLYQGPNGPNRYLQNIHFSVTEYILFSSLHGNDFG